MGVKRLHVTLWDSCHLLLVALTLGGAAFLRFIIEGFYLCFPFPSALDWLYARSKPLKSVFHVHLSHDVRDGSIEGRRSAQELVGASGVYKLEVHQARTEDDFILVLHRIVPRQTPAAAVANGDGCTNGAPRPPVLLMHGLMQDSEALLCGGSEHSLALWLAGQGYDVFIGNNRGNRYSHKHLSCTPHQERKCAICCHV
jgi:Partial alpha/beta-hydrolase lipase region